MKRLVVLNKIIVIVIIACFVTSCSAEKNAESDKNVKQELMGEYIISFRNTPMRHDNLKWKNNISYRIVELRHMSDLSLEDAINKSIEDAMTSWISGLVLDADSANLEIYCHSSRYLSFLSSLSYNSKRLDYIHDYITIDLKTGKRVMLDDLIEINEEFVKYIQKNKLIKKSINEMIYGGEPTDLWETLNEYTTDELLGELKKCSKTQQQVIKEGYCSIEESIGPLVCRRNSFYLRDNQLVIVIDFGGGEQHFTFDIDDISDFLKVEK